MSLTINNPVALQDYIAGRMSDTDRRIFEERLQNDAGFARDLEETLRLREGLEMLREQQLLGKLRTPRRRVFWMRIAAAAAAVVVLCVALDTVRHSSQRSSPTIAASLAAIGAHSASPLTVVERHAFAAVREATTTPDLRLPASGALELRALTPLTDSHRTFRATLAAIGSRGVSLIGVVEHLAADADGFVVLYADASQLQPGEYLLRVAPDDADDSAAERFTFRLTR